MAAPGSHNSVALPSSDVLPSRAEPMIPKSDISDKQTLLAVLQFLKKNNLKDTEELLKRESGIKDDEVTPQSATASESDVSHALAAYKSSDDPSLYSDYYTDLKAFIDSCLDVHKVELAVILYPVFVHMYLELVYNGHESHAVEFFEKFHTDQEDYYQDDLRQLSTVVKQEHMQGNSLMENFKSSKFVIKMSRDSYIHLKRRLQEKKMKPLLNIIQEHLFVDVFDGMPRNKQQIQQSSGAVLGESEREANRVKVYYGLLKEPDINIPLEEEEETGEGDDKPKKRKQKKDPLMMKKSKNDPNAPQNNRIPLPELKDSDKIEKITVFREGTKRVKINAANMPSICFYTLLNSFQGATCVEISEDSSLLAAGFSNSTIRVFSLNATKLRTMKKPKDLDLIDKETDDVLERMMDDRTASDFKVLHGHSGPVYATNFSRDRKFLISASEDGTIRLWSLLTWTNLVCYKGHIYPVWDVKFSPHGHYFVSCGHDKTARIWTTDHSQPVRIFAGHLSDVDCALFHPNSNYVATGSSDRVVRMWDNLTGNCVRILTGHKGAVQALCFSPDGRFLASSGVDRCVLLWDISSGSLLANMKGHTDTVYCLAFSREGASLASGGLDNYVRLWDIHRVLQEVDMEADLSIPSSFTVNENPNLLFGSFPTKSTPVLAVHFTRRNLLLASGPLQT
ncbi:transcription initiation factor TFIID subunit 5-like [Mizuhopecten yessoensis]|uniref:Transcription initiation factor TFIID subunit 5 n=1 Tax=Mizuhopecten yessoensis TaxID=6573 RepID=A0A210PHP6_MIZYE|nr:transcription initiation factor TFIID subunit 5-like [Mizuhopecten yessoensis]OWF36015.1 Transcription initiation factor TFIID subunit 5 [Mizuhopecten yessoensis]